MSQKGVPGHTVHCTSANLLSSSASFYDNFTFTHVGSPLKLNFAVKGTLVINGKFFDEIILAQGHSYTRNNWWFGGNKCRTVRNKSDKHYKEQTECTARDGTNWCFIRGSTHKLINNSPDHVKVQTHKCATDK